MAAKTEVKKKNDFFWIIAIALVLSVVAGLTLLFQNATPREQKGLVTISYAQYTQKIANQDSFVLFLGREDCPFCQDFKVTSRRIHEEHGINIYYLELDKISAAQNQALVSRFNFSGVPTVISIVNGVEYNMEATRISGAEPFSSAVAKFRTAGIIKE